MREEEVEEKEMRKRREIVRKTISYKKNDNIILVCLVRKVKC